MVHYHLFTLYAVKFHIVILCPGFDCIKVWLQGWNFISIYGFRHCDIIYTYFQWLVLGEVSSRSLIIIIKRICPSLVPWGTPALTKPHSDWELSIFTDCRRFDKKLQIHGIIDLLTPSDNSFKTRMLWSMR